MVRDPQDWIHIGERDLTEISAERTAGQSRMWRSITGRGGGFSILGTGASMNNATNAALSKYDLARQSAKWFRDSDGIDDEFWPQIPPPTFLTGHVTNFGISSYPNKGGDRSFTNSIVYTARFGNPTTDGLLVLVGSLRHSRFKSAKESDPTGWTPSSSEGLRFLLHLGAGEAPKDFDPTAKFVSNSDALSRLARECLVLADLGLKGHETGPVQFAARLHAVVPAAAIDRAIVERPASASGQQAPMPEILAIGAPLWLYAGKDELLP
jgi:hypothetical protein